MRFADRRLALACAILCPALFCAGIQAAPIGYVSSFDRLYRVDLGTGQQTLVGDLRLPSNERVFDVEGLAFAPDGTLFAVSDASEVLLRVDVTTGVATVVGSLGLAGQGTGTGNNLDFGLGFTCDGRLWLSAETAQKLWEVNVLSGATRAVGALGAKITGLAARGAQLYGIGASGDERLYRIDTATGASTVVGSRLGDNIRFDDGGLDFDADGNLWAVLDYRPTEPNRASDLARIDASTGVATLTGRSIADDGEGLAIAPPSCGAPAGGTASRVPAGSTPGQALLAALIVALGGLALRWQRRG